MFWFESGPVNISLVRNRFLLILSFVILSPVYAGPLSTICQIAQEKLGWGVKPFEPLPNLSFEEAYQSLRSVKPTPESIRFMMGYLTDNPTGRLSELGFKALGRVRPESLRSISAMSGALLMKESSNPDHREFAQHIWDDVTEREHWNPVFLSYMNQQTAGVLEKVSQIARDQGFDDSPPTEALIQTVALMARNPRRFDPSRREVGHTLDLFFAADRLNSAAAQRLSMMVYDNKTWRGIPSDYDEGKAKLLLLLEKSGIALKRVRESGSRNYPDVRNMAYRFANADDKTIAGVFRDFGPENIFHFRGPEIFVLDRLGDASAAVRMASFKLLQQKYSLLVQGSLKSPRGEGSWQLFNQTMDPNPLKAQLSRDLMTSFLVKEMRQRFGMVGPVDRARLLSVANSRDPRFEKTGDWSCALVRMIFVHNERVLAFETTDPHPSQEHIQNVKETQSAILQAARKMTLDSSAAVRQRGQFILTGQGNPASLEVSDNISRELGPETSPPNDGAQ